MTLDQREKGVEGGAGGYPHPLRLLAGRGKGKVGASGHAVARLERGNRLEQRGDAVLRCQAGEEGGQGDALVQILLNLFIGDEEREITERAWKI